MESHKPCRPGDSCQCPGCSGRMHVYSTHINHIAGKRKRYMRCDACGHKPERNVWVLPLEYAPPKKTVATHSNCN